jgi:hypothetical protein
VQTQVRQQPQAFSQGITHCQPCTSPDAYGCQEAGGTWIELGQGGNWTDLPQSNLAQIVSDIHNGISNLVSAPGLDGKCLRHSLRQPGQGRLVRWGRHGHFLGFNVTNQLPAKHGQKVESQIEFFNREAGQRKSGSFLVEIGFPFHNSTQTMPRSSMSFHQSHGITKSVILPPTAGPTLLSLTNGLFFAMIDPILYLFPRLTLARRKAANPVSSTLPTASSRTACAASSSLALK